MKHLRTIIEPRREENRIFAYAKTKTQISFAVTAKLISAFVFATRIVQPLYFLNLKFQVSSSFSNCAARCVSDLAGNHEDRFSDVAAHIFINNRAKLISAFVFATWIVQYLYFLNPKFQASSHLQQL